MKPTVTILVDDHGGELDAVAEHGFSVLLETENASILFDTGQTGTALSHNARLLGVNMTAVSAVVVSHGHYDHTGGLPVVFHERTNLPLFLHPDAVEPRYSTRTNAPPKPVGMADECVRMIRQLGSRAHWTTAPTEIANGIWATGAIPRRNAFEDTGGRFVLDPDCQTLDVLNDDKPSGSTREMESWSCWAVPTPGSSTHWTTSHGSRVFTAFMRSLAGCILVPPIKTAFGSQSPPFNGMTFSLSPHVTAQAERR